MNKNFVQYGLIISAIMIVLSVLFYILNLNQEKWAQWVGILVMGNGYWPCHHLYQLLQNK